MDSINGRLVLLISKLGLTNNSFAKRLGVSPTVTYNIIGGRFSKPSYDLLEKIILSFDNINPNWLISGKGEMFLTKEEVEKHNEEKHNVVTKNTSNNKVEEIALVAINTLKEQLNVSNDTNNSLLSANQDLLIILKNITSK